MQQFNVDMSYDGSSNFPNSSVPQSGTNNMGYLPPGHDAPSVTSDYTNYPPYHMAHQQATTADMFGNTQDFGTVVMVPSAYAPQQMQPLYPQEYYQVNRNQRGGLFDIQEDIIQPRNGKRRSSGGRNNYRLERQGSDRYGRRNSFGRRSSGFKKSDGSRGPIKRHRSSPMLDRLEHDGRARRQSRNSVLGRSSYNSFDQTDLVAMACDKKSSLEIQTRIAKLKAQKNESAIETMFFQFLPEIVRLSCDPFANFVIQRIIESLPKELNDVIVKQTKNQLLALSNHPYGCRVMQRILTYCNYPSRKQAFLDMMPDMVELLSNSYGCYVVQTLIENLPSENLQPLATEYIIPRFYELAIDATGTHVVQHACRYFDDDDKVEIIECAMDVLLELCRDSYGNYVVQKIIHYGNAETRSRVIAEIAPHILELSCHKVASNIIEKAISRATREESQSFVDYLVQDKERFSDVVRDNFGNYVVQKMIKILPHLVKLDFLKSLQRYFEGKDKDEFTNQEKHVYLAFKAFTTPS